MSLEPARNAFPRGGADCSITGLSIKAAERKTGAPPAGPLDRDLAGCFPATARIGRVQPGSATSNTDPWLLLPRVHDDIERILLGEPELRAGVERVAGEIAQVYRHEEPLVVAVLDGSVVFVADLIRRLPISLRLALVWARSYGSETRSGPLAVGGLPPEADVRGRPVLLVDDILDSGRTLAALRRELAALGAREVRTCVLLDKPARRAVAIEADHVGFEIEDAFVVGYGLDYAGRYRNLPYLGVLKARALAATAAEVRP